MENLNKILNEEDINAVDLEELIQARKDNKVDFALVDVRETFESESSRISNTDFFYPTSDFGSNQNNYKDLSDNRVVIYCRTGSRSGQVKNILKSMNVNNISHLRGGIMSYMGNTEGGSL